LARWLLKYGRQHTTKNGAANPRLKATMICVEGIIIPANWDNKGNVVDLVLAARDEEEYLIRDKEQVTRLKSFLRQEVKIKGILRTKEGKKIIKVKKFSKLKKQD
jgi:hypothetical protein